MYSLLMKLTPKHWRSRNYKVGSTFQMFNVNWRVSKCRRSSIEFHNDWSTASPSVDQRPSIITHQRVKKIPTSRLELTSAIDVESWTQVQWVPLEEESQYERVSRWRRGRIQVWKTKWFWLYRWTWKICNLCCSEIAVQSQSIRHYAAISNILFKVISQEKSMQSHNWQQKIREYHF